MPANRQCTVQFIEWMVETINTSGVTLLLVTHDRAFLEDTCTSILELDEARGFLHRVGGRGGYARYRQLRAERRKAQAELAQDAKVRTTPPPLHQQHQLQRSPAVACLTHMAILPYSAGTSINRAPVWHCSCTACCASRRRLQACRIVVHQLKVVRHGVSPAPSE